MLARLTRDEAPDVVQDVFLTAMRTLDSLKDDRAFGAWIAAIARHRAIDHLRARRCSGEIDDSLAAPESQPDGASAALALLHALPEAYRETLALRFIEGMSGREIAERTGLSAGSVRVNLHRGVKLLRQRLGGSGESA